MHADLGRRYVVGLASMHVSTEAGAVLVATALGSCLGVTVYDPHAGVGGLLHVMLPDSRMDPEKAKRSPCMFVDTGVPALFRACYRVGARKERMVVKVAGGAVINPHDGQDHFQVGKRNIVMLKRLLWKNAVVLRASDVGGRLSRSVTLDVDTGAVTVRRAGQVYPL